MNIDHIHNEEYQDIDFRMVTFTLGSREYGIDIMHIKEISSAKRFTFIPNTAPYVSGVFNLRGDIIPVIDLRKFFSLDISPELENKETKELIILSFDAVNIAVVVDKINHVQGFSSSKIQEEGALFSGINVEYIAGIIEIEGELYVLLEMSKIIQPFAEDGDLFDLDSAVLNLKNEVAIEKEPEESSTEKSPVEVKLGAAPSGDEPGDGSAEGESSLDLGHLSPKFRSLAKRLYSLSAFYVSQINTNWLSTSIKAMEAAKLINEDNPLELSAVADLSKFLESFASKHSGEIWPLELIETLQKFLPAQAPGNYFVLNPGCAQGFETYSLACILKEALPMVRLSIKAIENNLVKVSTAPMLDIAEEDIPEFYHKYLGAQNKVGLKRFNREITDSIIFEYQDISSTLINNKIDFVLARDLFSYLGYDGIKIFLDQLDSFMSPGGLMVIGDNEEIDRSTWELVSSSILKIYKYVA